MSTITKEKSEKFIVGRTYYWAFYMEYDEWRMVPVFSTWVYLGWTDKNGYHDSGCPGMEFARMTEWGLSTGNRKGDRLFFTSEKNASFMQTFDEFLKTIVTKRPPWDRIEQ